MMSQPNTNMSVIKASIDYLSSKFDQLLDDHQNILMKQRQDNANIMNQKHGVDPKLFNNLFQEQEHIQNSIEFLAQLEESYHNEARHLKDLIIDDYQNFRHSNQSSENVKGLRDPITALKSYIEINLGSLQTKVLSADGMEQLEIQVMRKLQTYFNEAFNGMEEAFMNYSNMSKKYSGKSTQQYDPIQIEQFCSHNFLTIESAAGGLDSIQQILIDHSDAMGSLASKYKKESKLLQENLNHIKQRLYVKTKETAENRTSIRSSAGYKQDRSAEKSTKTAVSSFDSKELLLMDQLVTQVIATNAYKNEVFNAIKKAADSLQLRLQEKIDSLAGNLRTLKETGGTLRESVAESQQERRSAKKSLTPPKRMARCPSQENTSFMDQSSKKKRQAGGGGSIEKKEQKKPSPSPNRSRSPQQPQKIYKTKSVGKLHQENPRLSDKDVDLLVKELRKCQNQFESYSNTMDQKLLKLHHNAQKFLNSSEKIAELVNKRGEEEIYALKIYQHDYTILRDSLSKLFVSHEAHQERRNSPTRSASQELLKQRERSAKRLGAHLATEQSREGSNERREGNDKKINEIMHNLEKAQTDILKTIYRDESYIHKTLETDEDFQLRGRDKGSQGRLKTEKSLQELGKSNQDLEKKFEKLLQESDILRKENEELYKKARKVREKADERKKTLKQLFELVMEKDKDINAYKEALKGKGEGIQKKKDDITKVFEAKSNELLLKVGSLEKKLLDKEFKLKSLTELTQKLMQTRQIKESKSAKTGLKLPKSGSRDDLRDTGKKTRQSPEIKGKNKETLDEVIEIRDYINKEADNLLSLINPKDSTSSKDMATVEQSLEILKAEKKDLEEKYHQMLEEMGKIHEDKSKLESEHQHELSQLREKVKNLHEKVQHDDQFKTPEKSNKIEQQQDVTQEITSGTKVKEALNERILELSKNIREGVEEYRRHPVESADKSQELDLTELKKINQDLTVQIQKISEEKNKEISSLNELVSILRKEIEDINDKYSMKQEPLIKDNKALKAQIETININVNEIFEWMKEDYKGPSSSFIEENLEKLQVIIKQREAQQKETIEKIHNKVKEDQARENEKFRVLKEESSKTIAENNEKIAQLENVKKQLDEKHENKVKELKQKIIEHEVANIELQQSMAILKEDLQSKENSINTQRKDLTAKITELEVLVENYKNAIGSQNNELAENNVRLETRIKELEELVSKKEGEVESKKKNLAMKNLEVQSLAERLTGSENTLQIYKHDLNTKEEELAEKTKEYEDKINVLNVQIEGYKKQIESENEKRKSLEEKIIKLEGSVENAQKEKSSKDNDYELKIQDYESRIQDLESTKEAQKLDIISLANDLNTQKDSFIDNIQELEKTIESLKEEASLKTEKFIQDLAVYQTKIQELETINLTQKQAFESHKTNYEVKLSEIESQKGTLEQELKKASQIYQDTLANLEEELKESKTGHQALIEAMNVKEFDFNQLKEGSEAKFAELESQKAVLEQELREAINAKDNDLVQQKEFYEAKISDIVSKNDSFKQQTEAYQKQIKDLQAKNEAQKLDILSRNNDLDTQSKELRKKLSDYEVSISIYKEEAVAKDKDLKSQAKEIEELKEKLKFKQAEIIAMDLDNQGLIKRLQMTEEEKTKTEAVLNLFDSRLSEFTQRCIAVNEEHDTQEEKSLEDFENSLQKRMEQLENLFQNRQLEIEDLTKMSEKERELLQQDKENLERRVQDIEINIAKTIETCERLENETQILNEKNSELLTAKDRLEQELENREVDVKILTEELQVLREAIRSAQEEENQQREILQSKTQLETELENTKVVKDFTEKRVEELVQRIVEVEEMYNEKEKYAREIEVRCQGLTDVLEELGEQRKKFIQDKNEERARYEKKIKELKEEINRMTEEQESVIKLKKSTSEIHPDNQEEVRRLEENIKELNTEKETLQAELNKKNEDIEYMREKSDNLQAALQNAGKRISQLIEEKEELEKGIIEEVDSQQGFDSMIEVDDRDRVIEELKQSNEENLRQLDEALAQNQQLQEKIQVIEGQSEKTRAELKSRIEGLLQEGLAAENDLEALKKEQEELRHQLEELSAALSHKEQVIAELKNDVENLNSEVQTKEDKIQELRESSQKDNQVLFQENDQLKEETKSQQLKIKELEEELEQLAGRWDEVKERIEELQTSLSHKESLIVEINNLNSEVNEQVNKLQEEISENQKTYSADIEALNNKYGQDIQQLETEKINIEKENAQMKEEIQKLQEEIAKLNQTLQEKYRITVEYKDHKEEMEAKNQKISELEKQVQELQQNLMTEASQKEALDTTIADLRREIEGDMGERLSQRDLHIDELTQRIATLEKSQFELSEENKVLRSITQRGTRTRSGDFNLDKSEIMCTSPNAEDDIKTKSYLTGNTLNRSFDLNTKRLSEEEYIKELHEKTRALQDENEKLEAENKQLKSEHELSRIMDEDLRSDLVDKDEEMKRLQFQLVVLKEELTKADKKSQSQDSSPLMAPQASISHEKEHIRTIFSKFMESLSQGNSKEVEGLLKLLTSLLDFDENAKSQLMNGLKSKSSKKGMLGRLF